MSEALCNICACLKYWKLGKVWLPGYCSWCHRGGYRGKGVQKKLCFLCLCQHSLIQHWLRLCSSSKVLPTGKLSAQGDL